LVYLVSLASVTASLTLARSLPLSAQPPGEDRQGAEGIVDEFFRALKSNDADAAARLCDYCKQRIEILSKHKYRTRGGREVVESLARLLDTDILSQASTWKISKWPGDLSDNRFHVLLNHPDPTQAPVEREGPNRGLLVRDSLYEVEMNADSRITRVRRFRPSYWPLEALPVRIVQVATFSTVSWDYVVDPGDLSFFGITVTGGAVAINLTCAGLTIEAQAGASVKSSAQGGLKHFVVTVATSSLLGHGLVYPARCLAVATTAKQTADIVSFTIQHGPEENCWVRAL
jgi:hypothetical protein